MPNRYMANTSDNALRLVETLKKKYQFASRVLTVFNYLKQKEVPYEIL